MSTDELLECVRRYALEHCPRTDAVRLTLADGRGEGGPYLSALVPLAGPPAGSAAAPTLGSWYRKILRAVAGLDAEAPTGPEIAAALQLRRARRSCGRCSALRKKGLLGGAARDQGYPITPAGLDALDQAGDL